ncbi:MAG: HAMP domain-containing protein [Chloroflexi bacterium]|nr:HAMP domain-containing protein [Chloroflexota bacterium]
MPRTGPEQRFLLGVNQAVLAAGAVAMGFSVVLSMLLAITLTRPIREMIVATQRMAAGDLDQRVPVRTQDELGQLAQSFNQMSARLALATHQRQQMTANIAHDLRTPLTVINGMIEGFLDQVYQPSPERFEMMHSEVQHLTHLIEDLRLLSLADAGELRLERKPTQPQDLLEKAARSFRQQAKQKQIEIRLDIEPNLPAVAVDQKRMARVLGNLISNALRYTPENGQIILRGQRNGNGVHLVVADNGQGIEAEKLPQIFDRFYRADESRHGEEGESGLGLAIVRSLVEAHGGKIAVRSQLNVGTTFTIALPAA